MTPEQLQTAVLAFIASARLKASGGLTVAEFGSLVVELIRLAVAGLDTVTTLDGPGKKAWALRRRGRFVRADARQAGVVDRPAGGSHAGAVGCRRGA